MKKASISIFTINLVIICAAAMGNIDSDLTAYYNFESLTGTDGEIVADQSGNGHNGICRRDLLMTKAPTIVPGPAGLGDALSFDGNFYVEIPNSEDFNITGGITIALWAKVNEFDDDWQTMFCRGDWSWRLARNNSTNGASFHLSGFGSIYGSWGGININDGQWHHIVGVWVGSGNPTKLWIDGVRDYAQDDTLTGSINTSGNDPVTIGAQIHEGILRRQWKGCLDEVRLYNRALSDSDVEELYMFAMEDGWNSIPSVNLPPSKFMVFDGNSVNLTLEGEISDDGFPLPANPSSPDPQDPNRLSWWWETVSKPSEANDPVLESINPDDIYGSTFVYDNPNQIITVDANVTLTWPGYYEFRLNVSDGEKTNHATIGISLYPVNNSHYEYHQKGYLYLSPVPDAEYESSQTKYLLVRLVEISPYDINNLSTFITVEGYSSGIHTGMTKIASDKKTIIFEMTKNFANYEPVTVSLNPLVDPNKGAIEPYEYQFMTSGAMMLHSDIDSSEDTVLSDSGSLSQAYTLLSANGPRIMPNGVSVPSNFPQINITINDNPDSGYIFLDNRTSGSNSYNVVFDNNGSPVWYWHTDDERRDMKVQKNGVLTMLARDGGMRFIGLDNHYKQIAAYQAVNGASTDEHELVVLENGYYFLFGIRGENVDMRRYVSGGLSSARVDQTMIQEFTPEGDLIFQWRGWDHFDIRDVQLDNIRGTGIRFPHMNAIDLDDDGQILLSSRHISEVTKIDKNTGEIIWRLGGNHSDYTFVNDPLNGFYNQHAVSAMGHRRYLLFDNGDLHNPPVSRAVEYELDPNKMTATLIWEYRETPDIFSHYMGNTQRLPNGNTLINWAIGSAPKLTEVRPDGTKAFEMNWVNHYEAYRVWRCQWNGMAQEPYLIVERKTDSASLIFNKFGDPNVAYYCIYGGTSPNPTSLWSVSDTTLADVSEFPGSGTYYFRVTAVDVNGTESGCSNEESVYIATTRPGTNIVKNGDFSQGITNWIWEPPTAPASATYEVTNGQFHYIISDGGPVWSSVQLRQNGIPLIQGKTYVFEFDAWADSPRTIEAKVGQDVSPWTNYSKIGPTYITDQKKHWIKTFTMDYASDSNARVVINTGTSDIDVYIDNVSLMYLP